MNQFVAFPHPPEGGSLHTSAYQRTMNKNGVWSTKHVKPTNATKSASVPPPSIATIKKTSVNRTVVITAAYPSQMRKSEHIEYPFSFKPSHAYKRLLPALC